MKTQNALVHLHFDFDEHLTELLRKWNQTQNMIEFVGVRPSAKLERPLLTPGAISDDEASRIAAQIRTDAKYSPNDAIIVFTEKRVYDDEYYQLFVGGKEADEEPPSVGVLSLEFMRRSYEETESRDSRFFGAIASNILFSIGTDAGLKDHGDDVRGCIMDFCYFMPDIEVALANGPSFCKKCTRKLEKIRKLGPAILALPEAFRSSKNLEKAEREVTEAILLRGRQYSADTQGFDYDVAVSFSGKDRQYADKLRAQLKRNDIAVFDDKAEQAKLWGTNLQHHLRELYSVRARYCIVLVSENYITSSWTKLELDAALEAEFNRRQPCVLPIRLDDTELSELPRVKGFLDAREDSIERIVSLVKEKLAV